MSLKQHRENKGLSERQLAAQILQEMGIKPTARGYQKQLRNMTEYVNRWEDGACRPSPKYMPHVIATLGKEVAASFYE